MNQTKNFYVGFDYPRTRSNRAVIFFQGDTFAITWQRPADAPNAGWWVLNRDGKASELGLPQWPDQQTLENLLESLEQWLESRTQIGTCA
jgi:hypothetical protein